MKPNKPDILFFGDTHAHLGHVEHIVREQKPDAIVLLGDIQSPRPLQDELSAVLKLTEVWWIHGNHDTDSVQDYDNLFSSDLQDRNLHGRVAEVAGLRIAGLGGIFKGRIWHPEEGMVYESEEEFMARCTREDSWRFGLPLNYRSAIFPEDYFSLAGQEADVLVTHEAPSCHPNGFEAIDDLARSLRVKSAFHGHHHDRLDYAGCRTRLGFSAYGVGLRGVTSLDGKVIMPGQQDEQRMTRQKSVNCD